MKLSDIKATNFSKITIDQKYNLAVQLGTVQGFYQYYFDSLPSHKNQTETFNNANDLYYSIFKQYKFTDADSFRNALKRHLKNRN